MSTVATYQGSKRQARVKAAQRATSDAFRNDLDRLAFYASQMDASDLDVLLASVEPHMRDEIEKLILALKAKQAEETRLELVDDADTIAHINQTDAPLVQE